MKTTPATATLSVSGGNYAFTVFTLKDAAQSFPVDSTNNVPSINHVTTLQGTTTTTIGYDFLASMLVRNQGSDPTWGEGENEMVGQDGQPDPIINNYSAAWKAGAASLATENITATWTTSAQTDHALYAIKAAGNSVVSTTTNSTYTYAGTNYANPHAVTQIGNGVSTTTYSYDNNGNLAQKTTDGNSTTYLWDYANRLTALGAGAATTTYSYDAFGQRVLQTGTTTTYIYPSKLYSVASSTISGAAFATTTEYAFSGDILLSTKDQQTASGSATGTAQTRYIHPDHLGSTNIVTNESGAVVQTLDYYPYGGTRISVSTLTNEKRKFIGQFSDDSGLSYLNARYYSSDRGQFISQDPVFLGLGVDNRTAQVLQDPQQLNSYSYARNNPITGKDPNGELFQIALMPLFWLGIDLLEVYGAGQIGYWTGEVINSQLLFRDDYTSEGRNNTAYNFVESAVGLATPFARVPYERAAFVLAPYLVDVASQFRNTGPNSFSNYTQIVGAASKQFDTWNSQSGVSVNPYVYSQSVAYSLTSGEASYTGPQADGSNPNYSSQTYVTPGGAIIDWGGYVVVPAPPPPPEN